MEFAIKTPGRANDSWRSLSFERSHRDDRSCDRKVALRFIVLIGILSFFADFTYEGSRSIVPRLPRVAASLAVRQSEFCTTSVPAVVAFCMATQLAAVPIFIAVGRQRRTWNRFRKLD